MRHRIQRFGCSLGSWRLWGRSQPYGGLSSGGDGLFVALGADGGLRFAVADAAGHGDTGAAFWRRHGKGVETGWDRFRLAPDGEDALRGLGQELNALLEGDPAGGALCLAAGCWAPEGGLRWATFGYGCHVFVSYGARCQVYRAPVERLFGLKLGWLDASEWSREPRAFRGHSVRDTRRLMITTDAWFPQDHRDIPATLAKAHALGVRCATLDAPDVLSHLFDLAHADDDATALVIERRGGDP